MTMPVIAENVPAENEESIETIDFNEFFKQHPEIEAEEELETESMETIQPDTEQEMGAANGLNPTANVNKDTGTMVLNNDADAQDRLVRPSSRVRLFKQMNNLKMRTGHLNQVLPIEFPKEFQIIWRDVSYNVKALERRGFGRLRVVDKQILHNLSGHFCSGQVTAIMGPSGAGKSTLLEILAGRRRLGLTGDVKLKDIAKVRIAFVPQNNYLSLTLTVFESLMFAARLQNIGNAGYPCEAMVNKYIKMFGLDMIRDNRINRCSGGQQKRLSIALELFQNPNILILDEPTTGLDSSSCSLVMKLIKELVDSPEYPMAIVCTIHQPAWAIFSEIDHVYIMTKNGRCLYTGSPTKMLPMMSRLGLVCDEHNSPPDYVIEIAAEDYGREPIEKLQAQLEEGKNDEEGEEIRSLSDLRTSRINRKIPFFPSWLILMERAFVIYRRSVLVLVLRIVSIILITMWLQQMFGSEIGKVSGCALRKLELYATPIEKLSTLFEESILMVTQNACCLFFGLMVGLIGGMTSVVLEFPRDMHILMKEYNNGWYSCLSYFVTKSLVDIPMNIVIPSIYVLYMYEFTSQPKELFREFWLLYITIMVGFVSESIGAICSAIFMNQPTAAAMAAGSVPLPMVLFGGFLVKYSRMPIYMQWASWGSLLKYAFQGIMVTMYGFNRCEYNYQAFLESVNASEIVRPLWARYLPLVLNVLVDGEDIDADDEQKVINKIYTLSFQAVNKNTKEVDFDRSLILSYFELDNDNILYIAIVAMTLYYAVVKIFTYIIILGRLNASI